MRPQGHIRQIIHVYIYISPTTSEKVPSDMCAQLLRSLIRNFTVRILDSKDAKFLHATTVGSDCADVRDLRLRWTHIHTYKYTYIHANIRTYIHTYIHRRKRVFGRNANRKSLVQCLIKPIYFTAIFQYLQ